MNEFNTTTSPIKINLKNEFENLNQMILASTDESYAKAKQMITRSHILENVALVFASSACIMYISFLYFTVRDNISTNLLTTTLVLITIYCIIAGICMYYSNSYFRRSNQYRDRAIDMQRKWVVELISKLEEGSIDRTQDIYKSYST